MTHYYQRKLSRTELLQAAGAGLGAGAALGAVVFYVARVFLQRTPLRPAAGRTVAAVPAGTTVAVTASGRP
jgi:hypothetical protein